MKHYFTLTTQDALVLSQSNATTGEHQTLDFIPGSAMLGALASIDYPSDQSLAWSLFHNGEVTFSNCYPIIGDELGLPTPLSWHYKKEDKKKKKTIEVWRNRASDQFQHEENTQYEQLRGEYVLASGKRERPELAIATKTAVDSTLGIAERGKLFNYQHICAAQSFLGYIECPDELDEEIASRLKATLRIGRSKGSEFGRVSIAPAPGSDFPIPASITTNSPYLTLWCISDIELLDELGCPTLSPSAENIHPLLKEATIVPARTFIRYHSVNRFNSHRQCFDSESRLITKGSVITVKLSATTDVAALSASLAEGIGINRHLGYGQVIANPAWAEQVSPKAPLFHADKMEVHRPHYQFTHSTPLTQWVEQRLTLVNDHQTHHHKAITLVENLLNSYISARKFNYIPDAYQAGPSRSQWRRVSDLLRSENAANWVAKAFEDDHCICKPKNDPLGWGIHWMGEQGSTTFADYCKTLLPKHSDTLLLKAIEILTRANPAEKEGLTRLEELLHDEKHIANNPNKNQEAQS